MLRVKALGASTRTLGDGGSDMENHHGDLMGISSNLLGIQWELHGDLMGYILQFHQTSTGDFPMDYPPAIKFR